MGTSSSQASPLTLNWNAVRATYRGGVPAARVAREVWRAAANDEQPSLPSLLMSRGVAYCFVLAQEMRSPSEALRAASEEIARQRWSSLGTEIAKRALVQSFAHEDRSFGFVSSLLTEATAYLVSRDLPSFVGEESGLGTVAEAATFKASVIESVRSRLEPRLGGYETWDKLLRANIRKLGGHVRAR
jgi:hypothetical protein